MSQLRKDTQINLLGYITERVQREESVFALAEKNHALLRQEFLKQLDSMPSGDWKESFDNHFFKWSDHTVRNVSEGIQPDSFDTEHYPTSFVQLDVDLDADFKKRFTLSYDLIKQYALAWQTSFLNTYISLPEGAFNVHIPGVSYGISAPTDYDVRAEEWAYLGDVAHNPKRTTLWTGAYLNRVMNRWVVSVETPIDDKYHRHLGTIGHDIVLSNLTERIIDDHLDGTYNLLVRTDGQLIAHPYLMDIIQSKAGKLTVQSSGDPHLQRIFDVAQQTSQAINIVYNPKDHEYLAIARLKGPNWYLITVCPEKILQAQALQHTQFLLGVGLSSLVLEVLLLVLIFQRQIFTPLQQLLSAAQQITNESFDVTIDIQRSDELGKLAIEFSQMARQLQHVFTTLEQQVEARTLQLEAARQLAKESNAKSEFLANMSHELRTPLTGILGYAQILSHSEALPSQERERVNIIYGCGTHLLALINDALDLAKIEAQKLDLNPHVLHLSVFLSSVVEIFEIKALQKDISFIYKADSRLPESVEADEKRLRQVLFNLLGNAIKFTETGSVTLQVDVLGQANNQVYLLFQVIDTGVGIDESDRTKLFEPFEQVGNHRKQADGTGLGLAISQRLVQLMGGTIEVKSQPGKGSEFFFILDLPLVNDRFNPQAEEESDRPLPMMRSLEKS